MSVADPRTREQRNYDVLQGVVTAGLRSTGTKTGEMRDLAQVTATITMDDLESGKGAAWLDDVVEPISTETVKELVCGKGLAKIIIGPNGEPLYLGKHKRYFTAAQMRALAVRDGGCVWPGCGAPASWSDGHHVRPFAQGGPTDIDNGASWQYNLSRPSAGRARPTPESNDERLGLSRLEICSTQPVPTRGP